MSSLKNSATKTWAKEKSTTSYEIGSWRQRYWGEPFPVVYDDENPDVAIPISESDLPLVLPQTDNFKPSGSGEGPLANVTDWVKTTVPGHPKKSATRG